MHKKKSGDGAREWTERDQWIKENFGFLLTVVSHRPEPCKSVSIATKNVLLFVIHYLNDKSLCKHITYSLYYLTLQIKATIAEHPGDLAAAEDACTDQQLVQSPDPTPEPTPSTSAATSSSLPKGKGRGKRAKTDDDDALLSALQKRIDESGAALQDLQARQQQPVTERSTFANYVRDSLLSTSKRKYKTVRVAVNRILSDAREDDSDLEEATALPPTAHPIRMTAQIRPSSAPSSLHAAPMSSSPSPSEMYQPPPQMWRHQAQAGSVWASQTPDYVDQYMQQPLIQRPQQQQQQQYQLPRHLQQVRSMPPPTQMPVFQQQQHLQQQSGSSFSVAIGSASQELNQSPTAVDSSFCQEWHFLKNCEIYYCLTNLHLKFFSCP